MDLLWPSSGGASRSLTVPTDNNTFQIGEISVTYTNVIALVLGLVVTVITGAFLRFTKLGTAMRAMADDREITATLGVPVRRVTAAAWFGCGCLSGIAGVLLADLVALDSTSLTFLVISTLAATLIARLRSITITFVAALVIGVVDRRADPDLVAQQLPRHDAVRARRDRAAGPQPAPRDLGRTPGGLGESAAADEHRGGAGRGRRLGPTAPGGPQIARTSTSAR